MNNRKNQNSILVLATLGVYLGLVLAGATPQVLAQAAMTRQFDVRDEIEAKDDVDKKPDDSSVSLIESPRTEIDRKVSRSIERFFSKITVHSIGSFCSTDQLGNRTRSFLSQLVTTSDIASFSIDRPLRQKIAVTNFPRADLDPLLS